MGKSCFVLHCLLFVYVCCVFCVTLGCFFFFLNICVIYVYVCLFVYVYVFLRVYVFLSVYEYAGVHVEDRS